MVKQTCSSPQLRLVATEARLPRPSVPVEVSESAPVPNASGLWGWKWIELEYQDVGVCFRVPKHQLYVTR